MREMYNLVLIQALAELAYSIALADGELQDGERETFFRVIEEELQNDSWWAKNRFKLLEQGVYPNIEESYKFALFVVKTNKSDFDAEMKRKFINVITKVANSVNGLDPKEKELIDRFKKDVEDI